MMYVKRLYLTFGGESSIIFKKEFIKEKNMCTFIKMEYLVANALVELYDRKQIDKITIQEIKDYGIKVEETLVSNNIRAILLYSNEYTKEFLEDYSEFFEKDGENIKIKEGKTTKDLREHILSYVPVDVLLALINDDSLNVINNL